jgi:hypothetical protein
MMRSLPPTFAPPMIVSAHARAWFLPCRSPTVNERSRTRRFILYQSPPRTELRVTVREEFRDGSTSIHFVICPPSVYKNLRRKSSP